MGTFLHDSVVRPIHYRFERHVAGGEPLAARKTRGEIEYVAVFHSDYTFDVDPDLDNGQRTTRRVGGIVVLAKQVLAIVRNSIGSEWMVVQFEELLVERREVFFLLLGQGIVVNQLPLVLHRDWYGILS